MPAARHGPLLDAAERLGLDVRLLLLTHHHHDHVAEADAWRQRHGVETLAHPLEAELLTGSRPHDRARRAGPGGRARDRLAAHAGPHRRNAQLRGQRAGRLHGRHALPGLGRRRARARLHEFRGPAPLDHGSADEAAPGHPPAPRAHRPDDRGRGVGVERLRAAVARPRRGGRRTVPGRGSGGDARAVGTGLRRRPQGLGALAGRARRHRAGQPRRAGERCPPGAARLPDRPRPAVPAGEHGHGGGRGRGPARAPRRPTPG